MKKVVHVINAMEIGGVEVGVLSLLKSNLSDNYHVVLVKHCDKEIYKGLNEEQKKRLYISNGYLSAFNTIRKIKPEIIVSSLWRGHLISLLCKLINPSVIRVHFIHSARFGHFIDSLITKFSIFFTRMIFCDSEMTKKWISNYPYQAHIKVLPMNVSFSDVKRAFTYNNNWDFIFIGRFSKQKNIEKSILFIYELVSLGYNAKLNLFGRDDGVLIDLYKMVDKLSLNENVFFHDSIMPDKVEEELRNHKFYLQTSEVEGMAISVFQSIKNGLLPVVTPVGEISNYAKHNINAFFLNSDEIKNSALDFIDAINGEVLDPSLIGKLINEDLYPSFDTSFFNAVYEIN